MSGQDDELLQEFLVESYENLDRLDGEFVALEDEPGSKEILSSIFRTIHTIKGTCGFLGFSHLGGVTHVGENLLSDLREGLLSYTDEIADGLLRLVDAVREMLAHIEANGAEKEDEYPDLVALLKALQENPAHVAPELHKEAETQAEPGETIDNPQEEVEEAAPSTGEQTAPRSSIAASNIRIQVEQLDKLMNLAGELVLARNQILQMAVNSQNNTMSETAQRLNIITSELQEGIMKIRMQPIGTLWNKFPRVVRDLAKHCHKQIRLQMDGKNTELDKTILEAVKDPLTHLIRNAVDHGIELPDTREASGKPKEGTLLVRAFHESGQVNIEIIDDGAGINPGKIKNKAIHNGLISQDQAASMTDRQALHLIFHAGLSTAEKVTDVSGRGVGMDVVKTNIERIGGTIEVASELGLGTTIRIRIPLTLAIIPALIVTSAGDRYAIPQVSLVELVRLDGEEAVRGIENLHGSPVYRLRGELLPLVFLDEELGMQVEAANDSLRNIVVVRADDRQFGLVVDDVNDTEEIVVKPLDKQIKDVTVYAGTTILGDGKVALIVDVMGLAERASVITEERHDTGLGVDLENGQLSDEAETYLIFSVCEDHSVAVPLSDVSRLEEFDSTSIEHMREFEVVQYRGEIMPLVRVSSILGLPEDEMDMVQVIVHVLDGQSVGLIVQSITDITEVQDPITRTFGEGTLSKAIVIDDRVTELLDVATIVQRVVSSYGAQKKKVIDTEHEVNDDDISQQFCTFYVGDLFFGVDVMHVQEVLRYQKMTQVPLTSDIVHGLINLRGQTVTALDIRSRLHLPARPAITDESDESQLPMNVVLRSADGVVSVLVDRIGDVLKVDSAQRGKMPATVESHIREVIKDVYKLPNALLLALDIEQLVAVDNHAMAA